MLSWVVTLEPQLPELLQPIASSSGPIAFVRSPECPRYPRQRRSRRPPRDKGAAKIRAIVAQIARFISCMFSELRTPHFSTALYLYTCKCPGGIGESTANNPLAGQLRVNDLSADGSVEREAPSRSNGWQTCIIRAVSHTSDRPFGSPAQARMPDGVALQFCPRSILVPPGFARPSQCACAGSPLEGAV